MRQTKRTDSGLNWKTVQDKFFQDMDVCVSLLAHLLDADGERTGRARRNSAKFLRMWWPGTELNRRRQPFQGCALPPELPGHVGLTVCLPAPGASCVAREDWNGVAESVQAVKTLEAFGTGTI